MQYISQWVSNIIVFILLAAVMDMLLPASSLKKYTKMVTGLLLVAIILTPIVKFSTKDIDQVFNSFHQAYGTDENKMGNLIEIKKKEIQASQHAYILEQMAVQLKKEANGELIDKYKKSIQSISLEMKKGKEASSNPEDIKKVVVSLNDAEDDKAAATVVKPVEINTDKPAKTQNPAEYQNIRALLSSRWNISKNLIQLQSEGGIAKSNE